MRKIILFPVLIILLSILSVQCTKDETSEKDEEITETKIFKDASNSDISFANKDIGFISSSINITTGTAMVAKTINAGNTWEEISVYIDNDKSANIRSIYAKSTDSVYATYTTRNDRAGVCLSSDGGYTWKDIGNLSSIYSSHTYTGVYFRNAKQGFVSRGGGDILKTENGGIDWTVVHQHNAMGGVLEDLFLQTT